MTTTHRHALSPVLAAALLACVTSAGAGFIDERAPAPKEAAATSKEAGAAAAQPAKVQAPMEAGARVGSVSGAFVDAGWSEPAPRAGDPTGLPGAISRLLPPRHASVAIDAEEGAIDEQVTWPDSGLSRKQALEHVARSYGLDMNLVGGALRVTRAKLQAGPAIYSVSPADGNFRRLLKRWSAQAGYTFGDEHWTLTRDVPIVASGSFGTDFKVAVRTALDATEFTAVPGRPCFYANNVLRVVPRTEQCNRSK